MPQPRVQSLDRALDLLEALARTDELGVSEVAAQTGLVPSTAHRLLSTLVARGYAAQNPATGRYLMGYKLLELTSGLQDRLGRLRAAARAHLEAIQRETGETTNLVVLEGRNVVYVDTVAGSQSVRLFTEVGRAIPAHTSGSGKALLAWRAPADVAALFDGVPLAAVPAHAHHARGAARRTSCASAAAATPPTTRSTSSAWPASPRPCWTTRASRWRRSACPARRRASCTPTRPTSRGCCASTRSRFAALGYAA